MGNREIGRLMREAVHWTVMGLVATVVIACGGGGGSSNSMPATSTAMFSTGAITGFGSVHLNGKKFDTSTAKIVVNGQSGTQGDLHVGDVVQVKAHHDATTGMDVADEVDFRANVRGPLQSIDATPPADSSVTHVLVVLGQTVLVSADTSFGVGISNPFAGGLKAGDILEVSGYPKPNGDLVAMRIELKPAGTSFEVLGSASKTDSMLHTFQINALVVDYSAASLQNFQSGGPADNLVVEATGTTLGASGQLLASQVEALTGLEMKADVDADAEYEGPVTRYASATDFDVAGRKVTTNGLTVYVGGTATDLATPFIRVEVEGSVDSTGTLVASKVQFEHTATVRIRAQVDAIDTTMTPNTLTVLGVKVAVTDLTRFEDRGMDHVVTFTLTDLKKGDWIEVRGMESPAGSNQLTANRIERLQTQSMVELRGPVKSEATPQFTILAVPVNTTSSTMFTDAMGMNTNATAFFTGLVGQFADAVGIWNGTTLTAQSATLSNQQED
jgi:hypothetical protein